MGGGNIPRFGCVSRVEAQRVSIGEIDSSRGSMHPRDKSSTCRRQGARGQEAGGENVSRIRRLGTVTPSYLVSVIPL